MYSFPQYFDSLPGVSDEDLAKFGGTSELADYCPFQQVDQSQIVVFYDNCLYLTLFYCMELVSISNVTHLTSYATHKLHYYTQLTGLFTFQDFLIKTKFSCMISVKFCIFWVHCRTNIQAMFDVLTVLFWFLFSNLITKSLTVPRNQQRVKYHQTRQVRWKIVICLRLK